MKKVLIAITGLFLITSLTINAQDGKKTTEKKMNCCVSKETAMKSDTTKSKEVKSEATKCSMKCSEMKEGTKCDPAKSKDIAKK